MIRTRDQIWAERAATRVNQVNLEASDPDKKKYRSFAQSFPTLIHTCGLMQASAFAFAKGKINYLGDFIDVLEGEQHDDIAVYLNGQNEEGGLSRLELMKYVIKSRDAIQAASWLKRYAEAILPEPDDQDADNAQTLGDNSQ